MKQSGATTTVRPTIESSEQSVPGVVNREDQGIETVGHVDDDPMLSESQNLNQIKNSFLQNKGNSAPFKGLRIKETITERIDWEVLSQMMRRVCWPSDHFLWQHSRERGSNLFTLDSLESTPYRDLQTFENSGPTQTMGISHEIEWYVRNGWAEPVTEDQIDCRLTVFVIPKNDEELRLILDGSSINDMQDPPVYILPDVTIPLHRPFRYMAKVDLSNSFLAINVTEETKRMMGFFIGDQPYRFTRAMWGLKGSPCILSEINRVLRLVVLKEMDDKVEVTVYVDDFLIVGRNKNDVNDALHCLKDTIKKVGFKVNDRKSSQEAGQEVDWLGFKLLPNRLELSPEKQKDFKEEYERVLKGPNVQFLQRFLGKALHFSKVAKGASNIIRRLYSSLPGDLICSGRRADRYQPLELTTKFKRLLQRLYYQLSTPRLGYQVAVYRRTLDIAVDAASDGHIGVSHVMDPTKSVSIKRTGLLYDRLGLDEFSPIHLLELYAILGAILLCPKRVNLRVFTDNSSCLFAVARGGSSDTRFGNLVTKIKSMARRREIALVLEWVRTDENPADMASRQMMSKNIYLDSGRSVAGFEFLFKNSSCPITKKQLLNFENNHLDLQYGSETLPMWRIKLLSKRQDVCVLHKYQQEILEGFCQLTVEEKRSVAIAVVRHCFFTAKVPKGNIGEILRLLLAENYVRWGLPQEAARRKIDKQLMFNATIDLGEVETHEFVDKPEQPRFSKKGKRIIDLVQVKSETTDPLRHWPLKSLTDHSYLKHLVEAWEWRPQDEDKFTPVQTGKTKGIPILPQRFQGIVYPISGHENKQKKVQWADEAPGGQIENDLYPRQILKEKKQKRKKLKTDGFQRMEQPWELQGAPPSQNEENYSSDSDSPPDSSSDDESSEEPDEESEESDNSSHSEQDQMVEDPFDFSFFQMENDDPLSGSTEAEQDPYDWNA